MSSRQEQKARRREERLAQEQAHASAARRGRRFRYVLGGLLVALVLGGGVAFGVAALGGAGDAATSGGGSAAALPPRQTADLDEAAKNAGCKVANPPNEGAGHEEKQFAASDYASNPPTSGTHFPEWYQDGIYAAGDTPEIGKLVHTLEHGRINLQYRPGTPAQTVRRLEALVGEQDGGYHMLLFENGTKMEHAVAATAWDRVIGCPTMNDKVFDALRAFRDDHIDKGPETVP
jgi:hypothetical protein